jgi:hypothetical protein
MYMATLDRCSWYKQEDSKHYCRLRGQSIPDGEVKNKCLKPDLATICVDAYSSLARGQDAVANNSTDAFPWLVESASQFANLGETDNAIQAYIEAITFANKNDLAERAYDFFRSARSVYENGLRNGDSSLKSPQIKQELVKAGQKIIDKMRKLNEEGPMTDMQAEIRAAVLGGVTLKKTEKRDDTKDLIISHGKALYEKKAKEYKEGVKSYIESGMIKNSVILACMGALADLMLGRPKEGIAYLTGIAAKPENSQTYNEHPCFEWTRMIFKVLVNRDQNLMISAKKKFLEIPWSFKDDREFARRVMDSVERRITA